MKRFLRYAVSVSVVVLLAAGCAARTDKHVLFQTATISSLMAGGYDGDMSYGELKKHGDFGLGTFNALDGEMIAIDGSFYQVTGAGKVLPVSDTLKTPFAVVTFFKDDLTCSPEKPLGLRELEAFIDSRLPANNMLYAIRIDGTFSLVKTRGVTKQNKPYPKLVDAVKNQKVFEFKDVKGTIVGFRLPAYVQGVNVPGYHFHFITADRSGGGHLLDVRTQDVKISIDTSADWYISLPISGVFGTLDLSGGKKGDLEKVEK